MMEESLVLRAYGTCEHVTWCLALAVIQNGEADAEIQL
jgi:hypothetical protein